jgi:hypothetical protein
MSQNLFIGQFHNSLEELYQSKSTASLKRSVILFKEAMKNPRKMQFDGSDGLPTFTQKISLIEGILKARGDA